METKSMVKLQSKDNDLFEVDVTAAKLSGTLKNVLEDASADDEEPIRLDNIATDTLFKVIEYCNHHKGDLHVEQGASELNEEQTLEPTSEWDEKFIEVDLNSLFHLVLAANYLQIEGLVKLCCKTLAGMMAGKTPEQIREHFDIANDLTPEEEAQIKKENAWCEDN